MGSRSNPGAVGGTGSGRPGVARAGNKAWVLGAPGGRLAAAIAYVAIVIVASGLFLIAENVWTGGEVAATSSGYTTPPPDVVGKPLPTAAKIIGGWVPYPDWGGADLLVSPAPLPKVGSAVIYVVEQGEPVDVFGDPPFTQLPVRAGVLMPDLSGMTRARAQEELTAVGLGDAVMVPADTEQETVVRGQVPPPGELVAFGAAQVLFDRYVAVPGIISMKVADAREALKRAGLLMAGPTSGAVVAQQPVAGTRVVEGSTVTVSVSTGAGLVVPNVVGFNVLQAQAAVEADGFSLEVPSGALGRDRVTGQSPAPNTPARPGQVVAVTVSQRQVRVPNLVGLTAVDAQRVLAARDLVLKAPEREGSVVGQQPPAGSRVARGSSVTVSLSPADGRRIPVPNLLGMSVDDARQALNRLGLVLEVPDGSGRVVEQDPAPLTLVGSGSTVTVSLRRDSGLAEWPWVAGAAGALVLAAAATGAARPWNQRRRVRHQLRVTATSRLIGPLTARLTAGTAQSSGGADMAPGEKERAEEAWVRERITVSASSRIEREW